ncbi:short chain dehydrogenase [Actinoplanes solisilvae]|uniref:short chain dehydrogenase n=1 Tax=Actinoplanes solisilvae TaxID=2486853 RepID=UPI000FDB17C7|nr:short chain dehydrogenase [Actinoplanes solisilvae]
MRVVVIGTGTLGSALAEALYEAEHEVVRVSRSGDEKADVTDRASLDDLFTRIGTFDAVACAAGDVFPGPLVDSTDDQWRDSLRSKGMGQIDAVRSALPYIADGGSFTLVSGILGDEVTRAMTIGATVNGLVESFVRAAATELPRGLRINCVSPTVLVESPQYYPYFPGFVPVPARDVALAYLRLMSNPYNGEIVRLHRVG